METYKVNLPDFQGPLDLLLSLIQDQALDITTISLAKVTDQYLAYLELLKPLNPTDLTDFLVIAAKLIFIKSEVLLPKPPATLEKPTEENVGDELTRQLLAYKQFKDLAAQLRALEEEGRRNFVRLAPPLKIEPKLIAGQGSLFKLLQAARQALLVKPDEPLVGELVARQIVTIGQQMVYIRQQLVMHGELIFDQLLSPPCDRVEVVVTFLAMLELIKRYIIVVEQPILFGEIIIRQDQSSPQLTEAELLELEIY